MKKLLGLCLGILMITGCNNSFISSKNNKSTNNNTSTNISSNNNESSSKKSSDINKLESYIYDENDLLKIKNNLDGTYYLANDINLVSKWTAIGDIENPFTGILDGNGYTIKNLIIDSNLSVKTKANTLGIEYISTGGLFGYNKGTIKNINIENYKIDIKNQSTGVGNVNNQTSEYKIFVGGLVGYNDGNIQNCHVSGSINVTSTSVIARGRIGGLTGKNEALVEKCSSSGTITSKFNETNIRIGGLIGASEGGTTKTSFSTTSVSGTNTNGKVLAGGLVGMVEFSNIENCYATGKVEVNSNRAATAGGLVGLIDSLIEGETIIENCYATGEIKAVASTKSSYAGGLIGNCEVLISNGGLIGDVSIKKCFYAGNKLTSTAVNKAHCGAIISCIEGNDKNNDIAIENCCYLQTVTITSRGETESKTNDTGEVMNSVSSINSQMNWDAQIWDFSTNTNELPLLK